MTDEEIATLKQKMWHWNSGSMPGHIGQLEQRVSVLKAELEHQWEYNHAEHCGSILPHREGERCHWPKPTILDDERWWHSIDNLLPVS